MKTLEQFIGLYPLSKTLRFALKPVGKTMENYRESGLLDNDKRRAEDYERVKRIIDEFHKHLINTSLQVDNLHLDWQPLYGAIADYRKDKSDASKKKLDEEQKKMRKTILDRIKESPNYKLLTAATPKELLADRALLQEVFPETHNELREIDSFTGFASFFIGYQENRRNIYTDEAITTAVPYRSVHDNFPKFLANIEAYANIKELCPEVLTSVEAELQSYLQGIQLEDVFKVGFYNCALSQSGIDYYNQILGGVTEGEGEQKLRGVNEFVNLYLQQHPELKAKKKNLSMVPLYKQILSDRETSSFIPQAIASDDELENIIHTFYKQLTEAKVNGEQVNVIEEMAELLASVGEYEKEHIYINAKCINEISQSVYQYWGHLRDVLQKKAEELYGMKTKTALKKVDSYLKREAYSLVELQSDEADLSSYFADTNELAERIKEEYKNFSEAMQDRPESLINDEVSTRIIKDLLDAYMDFLHKAEALSVSDELDLDKSFYTDFFACYDALRAIIPLYTKVRNYLTRKPYDPEKIKLTFGAPTLANGWDQNKERDNKTILLFKDGKSYLAVTAPGAKVIWEDYIVDSGDRYQKMVYKLLPGPEKMLPKVFISSKSGIENYHPSDYIISIKERESFKKGANFNKQELHDLIDFYKASISVHPDWKNFNFEFSPTESYEDISAFYSEVKDQGYKVSFADIATDKLNQLVDEGKVFLFQLYNKDYAAGAHGRKNLHTMYWESLFCPENLKDVVLKLNGEAELFYREVSVSKPAVHQEGQKMLNKRD